MANTAHIKNKYLKLLDTFKSGNLQTVEEEHMQALTLLTDAFTSEEYIHMPVNGERASRDTLDTAFTIIQNNHVAIEAALAALVEDTNDLEDSLQLDNELLTSLLEVLRTEITVRSLNTAGQEQYERQITESFSWPLTLAPENVTDKTFAASHVEWEPNDPGSLTWIGDLASNSTSPVKQPLSDLLTGTEIVVQVVAWSLSVDISDALVTALTAVLTGVNDTQPINKNDFFIISGVGVDSSPTNDPDGSGMLKVKLDVPELISHIQLTTLPADVIDHVLIINHQGVPTMYQMIDTHLFIRPTVTKEIHFHITGGSTGAALDTYFTANVNYEEVQGGSQHISGHFIDRISSNILKTPPQLASDRSQSTPNATKQEAAASKARATTAKNAPKGLQSDKARDTLSVRPATAKDNKVDPSRPVSVQPLSRSKASAAPKPVGAEGQYITSPELITRSSSSEQPNISSSKATKISAPRAARTNRTSAPTRDQAKPTSTPPGKADRGDQDITSDNDTPSATNTNAGSRNENNR